MPTPRHKSLAKPLAASTYRLRDMLLNQGVSVQTYAVAVAGLGCLGMLEEREAAEREDLRITSAKDSPWLRTWSEVYSTGGKEGLLAWLHAQREHISSCPFTTAALRAQVLDSFSTWDQHSPLELAARLLQEACDAEPTATFTSVFRQHWTELSTLVETDRKAGDYELREEFRWVLKQLTDIQPGQKAVLIQSTGMVFLVELMDSLSKRGLENSLSVDCHRTPEDLFALATLLGYGVKSPQVRLVEIDQAPDVGAHDWVIAIPPFGLREDTPDWCAVQNSGDRGESFILQRAALQLAQGGRCLALMPRSFCLAQQSKVREWLIAQHRIDGVIELPGRATSKGLGTPTALVCFTKNSPADDAYFVSETVFAERFIEPGLATTADPKQKIVLAPLMLRLGVQIDVAVIKTQLLSHSSKHFDDKKFREENSDFLKLINGGHPEVLDGTGFGSVSSTGLLVGPVNDELQKLVLFAKEKELPVDFIPLGSVAEVFRGVSVRKDQTWSVARDRLKETSEVVGTAGAIIEAGDLPDKVENHVNLWDEIAPSRFLHNHVKPLGWERYRLQEGDILIGPGNGSTCKVVCYKGLAAEASQLLDPGAAAYAGDSILVVRVADAKMHLLHKSYLGLPEIQKRIVRNSDAARGRIHPNALAVLEVPKARDSDTAVRLTAGIFAADFCIGRYRSFKEILNALEHPKKFVPLFGENKTPISVVGDLGGVTTLEELKKALAEIGDAIATFPARDDDEGNEPDEMFENWLIGTKSFLEDLVEALDLQSLPVRYQVLQALLAKSTERMSDVPFLDSYSGVFQYQSLGHEADELGNAKDEAVWFLLSVQSFIRKELTAMDGLYKVTITARPLSIRIGQESNLSFELRNTGLLPLRRVKVYNGYFECEAPSIETNQSLTHEMVIKPADIGVFTVPLQWSAEKLDFNEISGSEELVIRVVEGEDEFQSNDLGSNPYVDARTLQGSEDRVFFGREKEIARIRSELAKPSASTVLLVEGNRRTGKTSLLHHLMRHHLPEGWIAADCSFQSGEGEEATALQAARRGIPTREVFYTLAKSIIYAVVKAGVRLDLEGLGSLEPGWRPAKILRQTTELLHPFFQGGPAYSRLCGLLDQCLEAMGNRRLLLIIDEFDRLQEGIDSGVTSDQVPENIRHLFQTYNQVAGILTGSRKIRRLREQYWNVLFGIGDPLILRGLEPQAVRDLIIKPVEGRITYVPAAVERIAFLTAGQPRIVQTLCSRLFDTCAESGKRLITEEMVDAVAAEKARDYEHFKVLWSAVESAVHQYVGLVINQMVGRGDTTITFDLIRDEAVSQGVELPEKTLEAALADLVDLEVASERMERSVKHYGIEIPLMSDWLDQNEDIDKIRLAALQLLNL